LEVLCSLGEIPKGKQLAGINCCPGQHVCSVDVSQPDGRQLQLGVRQHIALYCQVLGVVVLQIGCGFYLDKTPSVFLAALEYVGLNDYIVMLKGSLENGRNI